MIRIILISLYFTAAHFFFLWLAKREWKKQAKLYKTIIQEQARQISILKNHLSDKEESHE